MDIKHVVNAIAVVTLGKVCFMPAPLVLFASFSRPLPLGQDMVFRDYVQGAYRMRGIGAGQKVHTFVIPEVADLMRRALKACGSHVVAESKCEHERLLLSVVAWLVINSMLTEQVQ
jgi:hypothetical protein